MQRYYLAPKKKVPDIPAQLLSLTFMQAFPLSGRLPLFARTGAQEEVSPKKNDTEIRRRFKTKTYDYKANFRIKDVGFCLSSWKTFDTGF
ncbi:MAG: hypothetical protein KC422_19835 [Trueperaceae bacterium]|nr:hypothetical protein [Trueperaceae bacterium]